MGSDFPSRTMASAYGTVMARVGECLICTSGMQLTCTIVPVDKAPHAA